MPFGDQPADCSDRRLEIAPGGQSPRIRFSDKRDALFAVPLNGERGTTAGSHDGMGVFGRGFEILRIVLHSADDQDVLDPARDKQPPVDDAAQVTGAQVRAVVRIGRERVEHRRAFTRLVPVPACHAAAGDPDFTDGFVPQNNPCRRVDNPDGAAAVDDASADERTAVLGFDEHRTCPPVRW